MAIWVGTVGLLLLFFAGRRQAQLLRALALLGTGIDDLRERLENLDLYARETSQDLAEVKKQLDELETQVRSLDCA